ncbi:glycosyltransferase [Allocoleopsis sp.]|uniref:glycosyltransferase n=1 Tax=Allocoleopsis sp. TaxID=3088169 RepID=UPI002FD558DC
MRLTTRPASKPTPTPQLKVLPRTQTKTLISPWIGGFFIASAILFVATVYITSWTSTGPTFLPVELSSPSSVFISPFIKPLTPPGVRYLPEFLELPGNTWETLWPLAAAAILCVLTRVIPSTNWTRLIVKSIILVLAVRYMLWRTLGDTMNFTNWLSSSVSVFLYAVEVFGFVMLVLNSLQTIWSNADLRTAQANRYSQDILSGRYVPSVDVFVPSYNEPEFIVRRTVVGCQAMDYPNKKVYILDDMIRPNIRQLAEELGCEYISREPGTVNKHAKAGNLNNALLQTDGELITVMDSDFVPFKHFLTRTVGFFQKPDVAIVQTPQDFYNPDHHVRNLGLAHLFPNDLAMFFRYDQSTRDAANTAMCCGTSYVIRRKALESVGGYFTRCVSEDSSTSTLLLTRGWRVIYLNETLSMGESTRNYADFMKQRLRWLQGNLQIFYCFKEVPVWSSKLNWVQKSYMVMHLMGCFQPFIRAVCLLTPLVSLYVGISPVICTLPEIIYYGIPFLVLMAGTTGWASEYHASYFFNQVYETIFCFPGLRRLFTTLRKPFGKGFAVTPKGVTAHSKNYNLHATWPLLVLMALTVVAISLQLVGYRMGVWQAIISPEFGLVYFWLIHNFIILAVAVLAAIDQPERRLFDRFPLRTACKISWDNFSDGDSSAARAYWGHTEDVSEGGAKLTLITEHPIPKKSPVVLEFLERSFSVEAKVIKSRFNHQFAHVSLQFTNLTAEQSRHLIEMLYTEKTWWKQSKRVGGLDAFLAMLSAFLKFRPLMTVYDRPSPGRDR